MLYCYTWIDILNSLNALRTRNVDEKFGKVISRLSNNFEAFAAELLGYMEDMFPWVTCRMSLKSHNTMLSAAKNWKQLPAYINKWTYPFSILLHRYIFIWSQMIECRPTTLWRRDQRHLCPVKRHIYWPITIYA